MRSISSGMAESKSRHSPDILMHIMSMRIQQLQLISNRFDDCRIAMAHRGNVVIHIKVFGAVGVEQARSLTAHQMQWLLVKQAITAGPSTARRSTRLFKSPSKESILATLKLLDSRMPTSSLLQPIFLSLKSIQPCAGSSTCLPLTDGNALSFPTAHKALP